MTDKAINIAENILRLRQLRGYNRSQLGQELGISGTMVSNYEKGISVPPLKMIDALCRLLNVSIEDLVYGKIYANPSEATEHLEDPLRAYKSRMDLFEQRLDVLENAFRGMNE